MKTCTKCNVEKPISSYGMRLGELHKWCRECLSIYAKGRYRASPETRQAAIDKANFRRNILRPMLRNLLKELKTSPCVDCGQSHNPWIMQFDHLRDKKFNIAHAVRAGVSELKLREEISKCELVCANCHAERTYRRRQRSSANLNSNATVAQLGRGTTSRA